MHLRPCPDSDGTFRTEALVCGLREVPPPVTREATNLRKFCNQRKRILELIDYISVRRMNLTPFDVDSM